MAESTSTMDPLLKIGYIQVSKSQKALNDLRRKRLRDKSKEMAQEQSYSTEKY